VDCTKIKTIKTKNFLADIHIDNDCTSPRDAYWSDNFGTLIAFHSRMNLSDDDTWNKEELLDHINRDDVFALPVYIYEHSGVALSTSEFMCKWDSGQVGYIFVSHEDIIKEYGELDLKKTEKLLDTEIETYSKYLNGECYGYQIYDKADKDCCPDSIDDCWGYIGLEHIEEEVKSSLEYWERDKGGKLI
tara:strand:- start:1833 stop:2399 length:567 start_codon:yes stop_codon:yes gene_type:complete